MNPEDKRHRSNDRPFQRSLEGRDKAVEGESPNEGDNQDEARQQLLRRLTVHVLSKKDFEKTREKDNTLRLVETPSIMVRDGGELLEECFDGENVFYAAWTGSAIYTTKPEASVVKDGKQWYTPVDDSLLRNRQVLLPSGVEEYENDLALFQEVKDFLDAYHDQPNEAERVIDVLYILLTYISDLLPVVPYRRILGTLGRGKTRYP